MIQLANQHREAEGSLKRALNQAARELLLAQASDWAFIMKTGTTVPYAVRRTQDHLRRFGDLESMIHRGTIDEGALHDLEQRDNLFPALDYRAFVSS
jgi:1,4-alpha-glucan branching enzyme